MARPCSNDIRTRVVTAVKAGESCRAVAERFGIAPSSAVKWAQRASRTGSVSPGKMGGHRKAILEPHREWLCSELLGRPETTLKELQNLLAERGVAVSPDTIWRFLRKAGFSFKKRRWSLTNKPGLM